MARKPREVSNEKKKNIFDSYVKGIRSQDIAEKLNIHHTDVLYILKTHYHFDSFLSLSVDRRKQLIIDIQNNVSREEILKKYRIWHRAYNSTVSKVYRMNHQRSRMSFSTLITMSKSRAKKLVEDMDNLPPIKNIKNWVWLYYTLDLLRTAQEKNLTPEDLSAMMKKYKQEVLYGIEIDETNQTRN